MLEQWNETACVYPAEKGFLHRQIEEQAERTPGALAVLFEGQELTYGELNCRANQLARKLISLGAAPGALIGVFMERSLEMVVGLLGILKSGAAYMPIDPSYPAQRTAYMIEDAHSLVLLTQKRFRDTLPPNGSQVFYLDGDWQEEFGLQDGTNPEITLAETGPCLFDLHIGIDRNPQRSDEYSWGHPQPTAMDADGLQPNLRGPGTAKNPIQL